MSDLDYKPDPIELKKLTAAKDSNSGESLALSSGAWSSDGQSPKFQKAKYNSNDGDELSFEPLPEMKKSAKFDKDESKDFKEFKGSKELKETKDFKGSKESKDLKMNQSMGDSDFDDKKAGEIRYQKKMEGNDTDELPGKEKLSDKELQEKYIALKKDGDYGGEKDRDFDPVQPWERFAAAGVMVFDPIDGVRMSYDQYVRDVRNSL